MANEYNIIEAANGEDALTKAINQLPDLIISDIMMPRMSGIELCSKIKNNFDTCHIPVILLTAKTALEHKFEGLRIGADDYISKPFSIREVIARVKAVLRRTATDNNTNQETLSFDQLLVNIPQKKVTIKGEEITLTKKEFEILKLLLGNQGHVFSREEILSRVWSDEVYVLDRTIDVNITRLRKKIGEYGKNIVTRLGYGYCFENA